MYKRASLYISSFELAEALEDECARVQLLQPVPGGPVLHNTLAARVVVRAVLPWRQWEERTSAEGLFAGLVARIGRHVDVVEVRDGHWDPVCPFRMHEMWEGVDVEAEKYWDAGLVGTRSSQHVLPWMAK